MQTYVWFASNTRIEFWKSEYLKYGQNYWSQDYLVGHSGTVFVDITRDLTIIHEREASLETILMENDQKEAKVQNQIEKTSKGRHT